MINFICDCGGRQTTARVCPQLLFPRSPMASNTCPLASICLCLSLLLSEILNAFALTRRLPNCSSSSSNSYSNPHICPYARTFCTVRRSAGGVNAVRSAPCISKSASRWLTLTALFKWVTHRLTGRWPQWPITYWPLVGVRVRALRPVPR